MLLITGATGFIGKKLIEALSKKNHDIRALCINEADSKNLPVKVDVAFGDITRKETLKKAFEDVDTVVHLAGIVSYSKPREEIFRINVDGTRNVLESCGSVGRFVFPSSVSVYGEIKRDEKAGEGYPLAPGNPYGESKVEAEKLILDSGLKSVILRIAPIYGAGSPNWENNLRLLERGFPIPNTKKKTHVAHVSDVVQAFERSVKRGNGVYNIAGREPMPFVEFAETIVRMLGKKPRRLPAFIVDLLARAKGMKAYLDVLTMNRHYVIEKAEKGLGYEPRADFRAEVGRMIEWYKKLD